MMKLVIYVCGTKGYTYAMTAQARRVQKCLVAADDIGQKFEVFVFLVGDGCDGQLAALKEYEMLLPDAHVEAVVSKDLFPVGGNYENPKQLAIAQMRTCATSRASALGADYLWSLDSDVLPPANALRCMVDMLHFDGGYYGVAACPYPSQGGGAFLCGRGTPQKQILPCHYEDEKEVPKKLLDKRKKLEESIRGLSEEGKRPDSSVVAEMKKVSKEIEAVPPKSNIFALNAKKWRKRGWFDSAYPAIGRGAVVPSDWCGFGCTLMGRKAISLCDWSGYDGGGTEDLYVVWNRWFPNNVKIAAIPHAPCDHVIRHREEKGKLVHLHSYHEDGGECDGHLRQRPRPWYSHDFGEKYSEANDGNIFPPDYRPARKKKAKRKV